MFLKHKRGTLTLRLTEKGRGQSCICHALLHTESCKIQPPSTDPEV